LGASEVSEAVAAVQQHVEGLAIDWVSLSEGSRFIGSTIAEGRFRTRTGASIVAIIQGSATIPAPDPDYHFNAGDVAVAVGTPEGLIALRDLLVS
jgi:TrkA domain protein